jgi:hypothetical protein
MKLTKLTLTKLLATFAVVAVLGFGAAMKTAEARDSYSIAYSSGPYYDQPSYAVGYSSGHHHHGSSYSVYLGGPGYYYGPPYVAYYDDPYPRCYWRHGYRYCCDRYNCWRSW